MLDPVIRFVKLGGGQQGLDRAAAAAPAAAVVQGADCCFWCSAFFLSACPPQLLHAASLKSSTCVSKGQRASRCPAPPLPCSASTGFLSNQQLLAGAVPADAVVYECVCGFEASTAVAMHKHLSSMSASSGASLCLANCHAMGSPQHRTSRAKPNRHLCLSLSCRRRPTTALPAQLVRPGQPATTATASRRPRQHQQGVRQQHPQLTVRGTCHTQHITAQQAGSRGEWAAVAVPLALQPPAGCCAGTCSQCATAATNQPLADWTRHALCPSVCVCLFACLPVCLPVCLPACLPAPPLLLSAVHTGQSVITRQRG